MEIAVKEYIKGMYIERIPKYTWATAMVEAGYTQNYADKQGHLCKARAKTKIDKAKEKLFQEQRYNLQDWENELQNLNQECRVSKDRTNQARVIENGIKLNGGFIDRTINLNADIPVDPDLRRQWLIDELDRISGTKTILNDYDDCEPAIASR
jgi:1,2-phenylacetyl-CoA epoxidase catalytic subunit